MPIKLWEPLFDLSVQAFYAGDREAGRWACECLLSLHDVPDDSRQRARRNQIYYAPLLPSLATGAYIRQLLFPVPPLWSRCNPSIAVDGAGYRLIVRSSNFASDISPPDYTVLHDDDIFRTTNYLAQLDSALRVARARPIEDCTRWPRYPIVVTGFEDCRLFNWRGAWYATGMTREHHRNGIAQIAMLRLEDEAFHAVQILSDGDTYRDEKNWMPFILDDELHFVYSCAPTIILRYRDGDIEEVSNRPGPAIARDFRGGSQGVELEDGFLFVVHETIPLDDGGRAYPHRFILLDRDFHIRRLSTPFFFLHRSREFCCGMARRGDYLVISFGFGNREAYVAHVGVADVLAILRPVYG